MRKTLFGLALVFLAAAPTQAGGFYIGAGIGQTSLEIQGTATRFDVDDTGYKGFIGYEFFRFFAVEAAYTDFGSFKETVMGTAIDSEATAGSLYGVGILPIGRLRLYGKAGAARWEAMTTLIGPGPPSVTDESGTDLTYGLGVDFRIVRGLLIRLEYETYDFGDTQNVKLGSLGLQYRFGG